MTIRIECDTYEELVEVARNILGQADIREPEPAPQEPEPAPQEPEPAVQETAYTQPEVRKFLGELRKAGKKEAVTALISSLGYSRFTDVPEDNYGELMEKAREL